MCIRIITLGLVAIALAGCSSTSGNFSLETSENTVQYGVVLSRAYAHAINKEGMESVASSSASSGFSGSAQSGLLNTLNTQTLSAQNFNPTGTATGIAHSMTLGMFDTPVDKTGIDYTIRKDNGDVVVVTDFPNEGDGVFFPGQRVMIQTNGKTERVLAIPN